MAKPLDLSTFDYILKAEREEENPTVFHMRRLNGIEAIEIGDASNTGNMVRAYELALGAGLLGWTNFGGAEWSAFPRDNMAIMDVKTAAELMQALDDRATLSEDEIKNS